MREFIRQYKIKTCSRKIKIEKDNGDLLLI